jgi:endonuclease G, mitochondrial
VLSPANNRMDIGAATYVCTNDDDETCSLVSINDVITLSGIDPFPMLGSAIKSNPILRRRWYGG